MTLRSPAGTVVTLTSDNGGIFNDVFNGTVWDDDANPLGQVPYTTNDGLATDHLYAANGTLASPLVPEEALAAFVGEDPNGIWTLTISDDRNPQGGSLNQWSLNLTTYAAAPTVNPLQSFSQATPVPILDNAVATSTLAVAGLTNQVCKAVLRTSITHTWNADLFMTLTSPAGTVVTLSSGNGGGADNVFNGTTWDDDANPNGQVPYATNNGLATDHAYVNNTTASPLVPEESMGAFMGEAGNGTWTLRVSDQAAGDVGSIVGWSMDLSPCSCPIPANPPADANPRKAGGFMSNGADDCRAVSPADDELLVASSDGLSNPTNGPIMVTCSQHTDEFARYRGNGTLLQAGIASFTLIARNLGGTAQTITCTGYAGRAGDPQQFMLNKAVTVQPGARQSLFWNAASENAGAPFQIPTNIVCALPGNMQINENSNRHFREVGDFVAP